MENLIPTPNKKLTILTLVVSKKQVFLWVVNLWSSYADKHSYILIKEKTSMFLYKYYCISVK